MKAFLPLLLLLGLSSCDRFQPTRTAEYRPEQAGTVDHALCLLGFSGTPLTELATGHQMVAAELNGRRANFVIDTGANATVLHAPYAEEFGLTGKESTPGGAVGLGGPMKASQVGIESLRIGDMPIRQRRIMVADLSPIAKALGPLAGERIYGIVGQDLLSEHRAVIDVKGPILYLIEADREPAPVPEGRCRQEDEEGRPAPKSRN